MNQKLVLVCLGVLISVGGCSSGKNYWLLYNHNPSIIPAATYQGYYTDDSGEKIDDAIQACVTGKPSERFPQCDGLKRNPGKRPILTDNDQAKVVVHVDPDKISVNKLECEIKQTKITRSPSPLYDEAKALEAQSPDRPSVYVCDLHVPDAGGMRLDYTVKPQSEGGSANAEASQGEGGETITIKPSNIVNDSIEVHTLYRFRVLVGPVYSSISDSKDRTYTAKAHAGGTSYVASDAKGNPVHAAAFLKYYWKPRDVYDTKFCLRDKDGAAVSEIGKATFENSFLECLGRINPIVGLSISNNPLENVYVGGSLDILPGLDIVGGVHWSSVQTLSGGFAQGQIVPNGTTIPTEQRFLPGWFVGIAVDTGVAGTWMSKAATSLFK